MTDSLRSRALRTVLLAVGIGMVLGSGATTAGATEHSTRPVTAALSAESPVEAKAPVGEAECEPGEFCLWERADYRGEILRLDLRNANPNECIPLPEGFVGRSFANRTADRHVTVYQGRDCSTEGDFTTYPGGGTFVPQAPFVVRGIQVWG